MKVAAGESCNEECFFFSALPIVIGIDTLP
jgi:hypothetical protein